MCVVKHIYVNGGYFVAARQSQKRYNAENIAFVLAGGGDVAACRGGAEYQLFPEFEFWQYRCLFGGGYYSPGTNGRHNRGGLRQCGWITSSRAVCVDGDVSPRSGYAGDIVRGNGHNIERHNQYEYHEFRLGHDGGRADNNRDGFCYDG